MMFASSPQTRTPTLSLRLQQPHGSRPQARLGSTADNPVNTSIKHRRHLGAHAPAVRVVQQELELGIGAVGGVLPVVEDALRLEGALQHRPAGLTLPVPPRKPVVARREPLPLALVPEAENQCLHS